MSQRNSDSSGSSVDSSSFPSNNNDYWKLKRKMKKERRRQRNATERECKQVEYEGLSSEAKEALRLVAVEKHEKERQRLDECIALSRQRLLDVTVPAVAYDMSFFDTMTAAAKRSTISQLKLSYSILKKSCFAMKPLIVGAGPCVSELVSWEGFKKFPLAVVSAVSELPRDTTVYLTADSDNVLTSITPGFTYVVGAFVDHNSKKGASLNHAKDLGFATARLPLKETIDVGNTCCVLTIDHMTQVLTTFAATGNWAMGFQCLPTRRRKRDES